MDTISNSVWKRSGSCIVMDQESLGEFITKGAMVSLRQALAWRNALPAEPPIMGRTILISGLETVMETMEPEEAEAFLVHRIRPLIIEIQNRWTACGMVFGFSCHAKAFEETALEEEVIFRRRDRKTVRLSDGLWDGTATVNMKRIMRTDESGNEVLVGYYVARIS